MDGKSSRFPVPTIEDRDRAFWMGVQKGILTVQKCQDCGKLQFFPRPVCLDCFSRNLGWHECKGTGRVYSFSIVNVPADPAMRKYVQETKTPFILAIVELDEKVRMLTEIIDCRPDEVKLGAPVRVAFREIPGTDFLLPVFRLE